MASESLGLDLFYKLVRIISISVGIISGAVAEQQGDWESETQ